MNEHRIPHVMKVHKGNRLPASLLFFDTETKTIDTPDLGNVERQVLKFGYAYRYRLEDTRKTREQWCRFTTTKQFFKFLEAATDTERPLYCFAHNLGFDLTILDFWRWSEQENFVVEYFVLQDPPTFIIGRINGKKVIFIDTLNYWRQSLQSIGDSVGLPKLPRPDKKASDEVWNVYGKRDVEVLSLAVTKLMEYIRDNDLGQFGLSAASMALSTYKHRFMKHEIFIHDNNQALITERAAYYGGFTHCFYVGKVRGQTIHKLDVNSMYPYVMLGRFPSKLLSIEFNLRPAKARDLLRTYGIVASVELNTSTETYPCYVGERLCYVRGKFTT